MKRKAYRLFPFVERVGKFPFDRLPHEEEGERNRASGKLSGEEISIRSPSP